MDLSLLLTSEFFWMGIKIAVILLILVNVVPVMLVLERRGSALMQNRLGPNRIGPFGFFQSIADAIKLILKEDTIPGHVNKFYYLAAPIVSVVPAFMTFAVVPFAGPININGQQIVFQIASLDVGVVFVLAISSLGIYGIILAGWASNSKYALFGSLRSSAQMISYELALSASLVGVLMIFASLNLNEIATASAKPLFDLGYIQIPSWGIFLQPIGFIIFLTAVFAETNRLPFDLPEGESEIVAGYHLEYGSLKFALFMLAEFVNMTTASALLTTLYFGGWQMLPGLHYLLDATGLTGMSYEWMRVGLQFISFWTKVFLFLWFFVWVRWTLPRFRYDQLMDLGWKVMLPLALVNILLTAIGIYLWS